MGEAEPMAEEVHLKAKRVVEEEIEVPVEEQKKKRRLQLRNQDLKLRFLLLRF